MFLVHSPVSGTQTPAVGLNVDWKRPSQYQSVYHGNEFFLKRTWIAIFFLGISLVLKNPTRRLAGPYNYGLFETFFFFENHMT